jgi:hypothetical protein|eukprot:COSAG01_NODE_1518_length_10043_cov_99.027951_7_plen_233_part_00
MSYGGGGGGGGSSSVRRRGAAPVSSGWDQTMTGGLANGGGGAPGMPREEQAPAWLRHLAWPALVVLGTVGLLLALLNAWEDSSGADPTLRQAAEYTGAGVLAEVAAGAAAQGVRSARAGAGAGAAHDGSLLQSTLEELRMQSAMQTQVMGLPTLAVAPLRTMWLRAPGRSPPLACGAWGMGPGRWLVAGAQCPDRGSGGAAQAGAQAVGVAGARHREDRRRAHRAALALAAA